MIRLGKVIVVASEIKKISCIWRQHNKLLQNMWVKTAVYCMDHYYISHSGSSDDLIQRWLIFAGMFVKVTQSCPTLPSHELLHVCDPMEFSRPEYWRGKPFPPGDLPNPGIKPRFPALQWFFMSLANKGNPRILEWGAYSFSSESSRPRNQTGVSFIARRFFINWAIREAGMFMCVISLSGLVI